MIEELPKLIELGALGLICFYLVFKGVSRMQDLTNSIKDLSSIINEMRKHIDVVDTRINNIDNKISTLERSLRDDFRELKLVVVDSLREVKDGTRKD